MISVLRVSTMLLLSLSSLSAFVMFADAGGTSSAEEQEGVSYLVSNAQAPGVVVLPSGLQYKILRHGSGNAHPIEKTSCSFHYAGRLTTGTGETFDASYDRGKPTEVRPEQAIQGWSEAMKLMRKGDKWELTIPSHLAYGDRALPELGVPANAVLIYEVELVTMFGPTTPVVSPCTVIGGKFSSNEENGMEAPPLNFVECNTKEETYASKVYTKWTNEKVKSELTRLLELQKKGNVKSELLEWMDKRVRILNYVVSFENNVEYDEGGKAKDDTNMFDFRHDHDHDHEEGGHSHGHHGHHRHDGDQQDHGHDHDGRDHQQDGDQQDHGHDHDGRDHQHDHEHDHEHGHQHHGHEVYKSE